jgi:hypothetical protein
MRNLMNNYDINWTSQSKDSSESMPIGGKDTGCNVWVEEDNLYIYLQQGGWFDENNSLLKYGRIKISGSKTLFKNNFKQTLHIEEGYIDISSDEGTITLFVDKAIGTFHAIGKFKKAEEISVSYQTWRWKDRFVNSASSELFQCKEVYQRPNVDAHFFKDEFLVEDNSITSYHKNSNTDLSIDILLEDQGLMSLKDKLYNPQYNRIFGGKLILDDMKYIDSSYSRYMDTDCKDYNYKSKAKSKNFNLSIALNYGIYDFTKDFLIDLNNKASQCVLNINERFNETKKWWIEYYKKSYVEIDGNESDPIYRVGKNYQLFRFMLAANIDGYWPTKFNGGLHTFDPSSNTKGIGNIPEKFEFTPDYRRWGGAAHTIQNQRLVYWPMLKQGDFKTMKQQFNLMERALSNAILRTKFCFGCDGAVFPEQMNTYGLCNNQDMGWENTTGWPEKEHIRYHFSNSLEMIVMLLDYKDYSGESIEEYMDFITSILSFYNDFYNKNDSNGKMIIYPAGCMETYSDVKNPIDSIAGLNSTLKRLVKLNEDYITQEQKDLFTNLLKRVPPYSFATKDGKTYLKYGESKGHKTNCENPETYVLFPFRDYGFNKEEREIARNTIKESIRTPDQNLHYSWHTLGVEYAEVNDIEMANKRLIMKMDDGPYRFSAFYGPGHDWSPDYNWGGAGMLQIQEMLLREDDDNIYLIPCWSEDINVTFKLYGRDSFIYNVSYKNKEITIKSNKKITKNIVIPEFCKSNI